MYSKTKKNIYKKVVLMLISLSAIQCFTSPEKSARQIPLVENLDIKKFTESPWYEISRIPIPIGSDWVNTISNYTFVDGKIKASYEGRKLTKDGEKKSLSGKAELETNSYWRISYIPFIYSDYRIIKITNDYKNAIVTSGTKDNLWILCKNPKMDEKIYEEFLSFSKSQGFDISKLEKVSQDW
jgi:apolipoprotein D and lipocalin family protein